MRDNKWVRHLDNITDDMFSKIHVPRDFIDVRFRSKYVQRLTENRNKKRTVKNGVSFLVVFNRAIPKHTSIPPVFS